ncbi:MAG TPA: UDP-N-acetylmuramate dehydrogenase [Thiothrix sp.]|nr:UDP-N-acetylmuramate dehydrogenase [Thiothrix sp.]
MHITENQSLQSYNSFGVAAKARYFTVIKYDDDVAELVKWLKQHPLLPYLLVGGGSNLLFTKDYQGLVIHIALTGKQVVAEDTESTYIRAAAGENWHGFVLWSIAQGYAGLENLSLIPGTVGAAPVQNIGAYGVELTDCFFQLEAVDLQTGKMRVFDHAACEFAYRDSYFKSVAHGGYLIVSVTFRLLKKPQWKMHYADIARQLGNQVPTAQRISTIVISIRQSKLPDPAVLGNAGSFFKNPLVEKQTWLLLRASFQDMPAYEQLDKRYKLPAAWLIDQCHWKGYQQGDAGVYAKHALVLVNHGTATGEELWLLAQQIIDSVQEKFGITLEPEPSVIN